MLTQELVLLISVSTWQAEQDSSLNYCFASQIEGQELKHWVNFGSGHILRRNIKKY